MCGDVSSTGHQSGYRSRIAIFFFFVFRPLDFDCFHRYWGLLALLLGARTLLGAPAIATRSKDATRNKTFLVSFFV